MGESNGSSPQDQRMRPPIDKSDCRSHQDSVPSRVGGISAVYILFISSSEYRVDTVKKSPRTIPDSQGTTSSHHGVPFLLSVNLTYKCYYQRPHTPKMYGNHTYNGSCLLIQMNVSKNARKSSNQCNPPLLVYHAINDPFGFNYKYQDRTNWWHTQC